MQVYAGNPSFSNQKNLEETEQQLDEVECRVQVGGHFKLIRKTDKLPSCCLQYSLKLDLLEATHYKLSASLSELDGTPKSFHRFKDSIVKWKDKVRQVGSAGHEACWDSGSLQVFVNRQLLIVMFEYLNGIQPNEAEKTQVLPDNMLEVLGNIKSSSAESTEGYWTG